MAVFVETVELTHCTCERCGYEWISRMSILPLACSQCKTYAWNTPRRMAKRGGANTVTPPGAA